MSLALGNFVIIIFLSPSLRRPASEWRTLSSRDEPLMFVLWTRLHRFCNQPVSVRCLAVETSYLSEIPNNYRPWSKARQPGKGPMTWFSFIIYYRPQHSCGKVMFSQASVILGGGGGWGGGRAWQEAGETATAADGTHPTRMHSCLTKTDWSTLTKKSPCPFCDLEGRGV